MSNKDWYEGTDSDVFARIIDEVHKRGGAVAIFTREELGVLDAEDVEDAMITAGNERIDLG